MLYGRPVNDDDLYSHLMYPQVFADFMAFRSKYDDLSTLPTPAFFYGLHIGEEIEIEIDTGKILIIKLISIGEADSALAVIQPWLMAHDIYARGRFGAWRYELGNMDHSVKMGVDVARLLVAGTPEAAWS